MTTLMASTLGSNIVPVAAADVYVPPEQTGFINFVEGKGTTFSDVSGWSEPYIFNISKLGLIEGTSETTFSPEDHLTVEQALVLAVRVNAIYYKRKFPEKGQGSDWSLPYLDYAIKYKITSDKKTKPSDLKNVISRNEAAEFFCRSTINFRSSSNVGSFDNFNRDFDVKYNSKDDLLYKDKEIISNGALTFFSAGIMNGNSAGLELEKPLTRAEASTLLWRLIKKDERGKAGKFENIADATLEEVVAYFQNTLFPDVEFFTFTPGQSKSQYTKEIINTKYGSQHTYMTNKQAEYDALVAHVEERVVALMPLLTERNMGKHGHCTSSPATYDYFAGQTSREDLQDGGFITDLEAIWPNSTKDQFTTLKLTGALRILYSEITVGISGVNEFNTPYNALIAKKGMFMHCEAQAALCSLILDILGLNNRDISSISSEHQTNSVLINGQWVIMNRGILQLAESNIFNWKKGYGSWTDARIDINSTSWTTGKEKGSWEN